MDVVRHQEHVLRAARHLMHPDRPEKITDLIGKEVTVEVNLHPLVEGVKIKKAVLNYVSKTWVGISWLWRGRIHRDHIPLPNVIRVTRYVNVKRQKGEGNAKDQ
jgi:hypothetical protein